MPEDDVETPGAVVIGNFELPDTGSGNSAWGLHEQDTLVTTEPSLQLP